MLFSSADASEREDLTNLLYMQDDDEEEGPPGPAPSPADSGASNGPLPRRHSPPFSRPPGVQLLPAWESDTGARCALVQHG